MKMIIEGSFYAFMLSVIVFISVNFIMVNSNVTEKNQELRSIETYLESNGRTEQTSAESIKTGIVDNEFYVYNNVRYKKSDIDNAGSSQVFNTLTDSFAEHLKNAAGRLGIDLTLTYMNETSTYGYIEYNAKYPLAFPFFRYSKDIVSSGIARYNLSNH